MVNKRTVADMLFFNEFGALHEKVEKLGDEFEHGQVYQALMETKNEKNKRYEKFTRYRDYWRIFELTKMNLVMYTIYDEILDDEDYTDKESDEIFKLLDENEDFLLEFASGPSDRLTLYIKDKEKFSEKELNRITNIAKKADIEVELRPFDIHETI